MPVFSWDPAKRLANLDKHGVDFADVEEFGWEEAAIIAARPDRLGRPRFKAIGRLRGRQWS